MIELLFRRPAFRRLWLGETISLLGDWLSYVALSVLVLQQGGGALALAIVFAGHVLPTALVSPIAGVIVDRVDRRRALVAVQLLQAAVMVAMVAGVVGGALVLVQVLLFVRTAVAGFFYPAKQAALKRVVAADELFDANALDAATWSITFALGTALGGLLALLGPVLALTVDTATFLIAALVLSKLDPIAAEASPAAPLRSPWDLAVDLRAALTAAAPDRRLLEAVFSKMPMAFAGGAAWVLLNLTAFHLGVLGSSALGLGLLQAVRGAGTGLGPLAARRLLQRGTSATLLLRLATLVVLAALAAFTLATVYAGVAVLAVTVFFWGVGSGSNWVFSSAEMQRRAPPGTLGRLASVDQLAFTTAQSGAALAAGYLVDKSGSASSAGWLGVFGGLALVSLLWWTLSRRPRVAMTTYAAP